MPCDYKNYPSDWAQIRTRILDRAKDKCEQCGVRNRAVISRLREGFVVAHVPGTSYKERRKAAEQMTREAIEEGRSERYVTIVLTIAHLDHDTKNNEESNLKALCQKCHLAYDADLHRVNAEATRKKKQHRIQGDFDVATDLV